MPTIRDHPAAVGPVEYAADREDLRAAYNRGRLDERMSRRRHPIIAIAVVILALIGAWLLFLAAREGSFSSAGQAADRGIATAADEAGPALRETGEALKDAGGAIKDKTQNMVADTRGDAAVSAPTEPAR